MNYTPDQYLKVLQSRAKKWQHLDGPMQKFRDQIEHDAQQLLSGTTSSRELRDLNYPFGRGMSKLGPRGFHPRLPINQQSRSLYQALQVRYYRSQRTHEIRVSFRRVKSLPVLTPKGTRRMKARGFWAELRRRQVRRQRQLAHSIKIQLRFSN